ncbi:hypothetical protein JW758_04240 [Candidatus Peregrinibacteria bacterium]|nr:hypothetical protein [Candidatus Peregrinibacteria bacterium]
MTLSEDRIATGPLEQLESWLGLTRFQPVDSFNLGDGVKNVVSSTRGFFSKLFG